MATFQKTPNEPAIEAREVFEVIAVFDIAGFTLPMVPLSSAELLDTLQKYLEDLFSIIESSGGAAHHVDGNAMRAYWPASESSAVNERIGTAIVQALSCIRAFELPDGRRFVPKIGLACGKTIHANLAVAGKVLPVSLGATMNFASRLSMMCSSMKKEILFPSSLPVVWPEGFITEEVGPISIVGSPQQFLLLTLVGKLANKAPEPTPGTVTPRAI